MGHYTVTPAYGRDYNSQKEAKADFLGGKDFELMATPKGPNFLGRYCSVEDMEPGEKVHIRYRKNTQVVVVEVPK